MESVASDASSSFRLKLTTTSALMSSSISSLPCLRRRYPVNRGVCFAVKAGSDGGKLGGRDAYGFDLLQKPIIAAPVSGVDEELEKVYGVVSDDGTGEESGGKEREWVDWEDQILEDTVPLVGFARMILHSRRYHCGDRLRPEHEKAVLERLLCYHPDCEKKIGCGVDYITIGYHPEFEDSRCLFIVRKDGEKVDFSYWKCLKGLIRKNYPAYADTFISRHFQRRRRSD